MAEDPLPLDMLDMLAVGQPTTGRSRRQPAFARETNRKLRVVVRFLVKHIYLDVILLGRLVPMYQDYNRVRGHRIHLYTS